MPSGRPATRRISPGRLTLVAAGAGGGKTTLVASWFHVKPAQRAWFSVDATDSGSGAVIAALDGVVPGFATRLLGAPGASTAADVIPALLDELAALDAPVTLIVDDYHLAGSAEIHIGVGFLATHLPATLRLVLVSRTVPPLPLPLAQLRGQGRVAELGTEDLRLSAAESAELLDVEGAVTGTAWTPDEAARLHARTEGWVIGVHLGVLSRRGHPDAPLPGPSPVPSGAGAGPTRHLVDYLRRDVLDPLPDELRAVLRRTAVLDVFRGDR